MTCVVLLWLVNPYFKQILAPTVTLCSWLIEHSNQLCIEIG